MKTRIAAKENEVEFSTISVGECFTYGVDVFLRVNASMILSDPKYSFAVNMSSGLLNRMNNHEKVVPIEAELIVNRFGD